MSLTIIYSNSSNKKGQRRKLNHLQSTYNVLSIAEKKYLIHKQIFLMTTRKINFIF